jgi:hypothetical protein
MAELDKVNNSVVFSIVVVTAVVLVAMVFGTARLFDLTMREEIERKVLSVESTQLRQLRVEEERKVNSYQWVDPKGGVVRVPVERAVELIVSEGYQRPAPSAAAPPPSAVAPAPTGPAPSPAPAGGTH